ncbi:MAG: hypothetical protein ABI629_08380 [bacterium]
MRKLFAEGRCRECGSRVTVDHDGGHHLRNGASCGPVDTHRPSAHSDTPHGIHWKGPARPH